VWAFGEANTTWAGHISIITVDGIQMVTCAEKVRHPFGGVFSS
jgi:hypothetical protein